MNSVTLLAFYTTRLCLLTDIVAQFCSVQTTFARRHIATTQLEADLLHQFFRPASKMP
jgi:hypothetical protein